MIIRTCIFLSLLLAHSVVYASQKPSTGIAITDPAQRVISDGVEQTINVTFRYPYTSGKGSIRYQLSDDIQRVSGELNHSLDFEQTPKQLSTTLQVVAAPGKHYLTIYIQLDESTSGSALAEVVNLPIQAGDVIAVDASAYDKNLPQGVSLQKSLSGDPEMIIMPAEEIIITH